MFSPFESCENTIEELFVCYIEIYWNYYYYYLSKWECKIDLFTAIDALRQFKQLRNVEKGPLWVTFTAVLDISINLNIKNIVMIIKNAVYEGTSLGFEIESELFFGSLSYPVGKGGADSCWPGASTWTTAKCWVISCMSSKLNSVLKHDLSASQEKNKDTSQKKNS